MNKENVEKWIAALRSGEYRQDVGKLRTDEGFCCLGVACDIYGKEKGVEWSNGSKEEWIESYNGFNFKGAATFMPSVVCEYLEMDFNDLRIEYIGRDCKLDYLNDIDKLSFNKIADLLEEKLFPEKIAQPIPSLDK